jgi:GTP-binding protein
VRFLFFVNRIKAFPPVYIQYLKNCIRRDLGFTLIPIEIDLRERRRNPSLHTTSRSEFLSDEDRVSTDDTFAEGKASKPAKAARQTSVRQASGRTAATKPAAKKPSATKRTGGKAKAAPKPRKPGNKAAKGKAEKLARTQERNRRGRAK